MSSAELDNFDEMAVGHALYLLLKQREDVCVKWWSDSERAWGTCYEGLADVADFTYNTDQYMGSSRLSVFDIYYELVSIIESWDEALYDELDEERSNSN